MSCYDKFDEEQKKLCIFYQDQFDKLKIQSDQRRTHRPVNVILAPEEITGRVSMGVRPWETPKYYAQKLKNICPKLVY